MSAKGMDAAQTGYEGKDAMMKKKGSKGHAYKADDDNDMDEGEEEEEKEEEKGKSMDVDQAVTEEELQKSLDALEEVIGEDSTTRKDALLSKAQTGELDDEERTELFQLLGGESEDTAKSLTDEALEGLRGNETIQKSLDVSEYLHEQQAELVSALATMGDAVEKSDRRQHGFNLVLAKAVATQGKLVKAMSERMGILAKQPARAPKARGVSTIEKGLGGQPPGSGAEGQLSKSQVLDVMEAMHKESIDKGREGQSRCGEDFLLSIEKYERSSRLSKAMHEEIIEFHKSQAGSLH